MIVYKTGDWETDRDAIIELCGTWWKDSLFYKLYKVDYKVDLNLFEIVKNAGGLIYTTGWDDYGKLVSCYVGIKSPYMFNRDLITVAEVVWCIRKENRCFKNLVGLIKAIERLMERESIVLWNLNVSNEEKYNSTGKFLEAKGYYLMDKCFTKITGEKNG